MKIGCPTEIKPQEFRVGLTPSAALEATRSGHDVIVQQGPQSSTPQRKSLPALT
jgi:alanine dehydrogenase